MASLFNKEHAQANKKYSIAIQWNNIKQAAFFLFHLSLNNVNKSSLDIFILSTFDGLQCLSFSFLLAFNHQWAIQDFITIHYYLDKFFKIFLLTPYLIESSYSLFLVALFASIGLTLLVLSLFAYLIYLIHHNTVLSKWHISLFDSIARYYSGVMFIPILKVLLPLANCHRFILDNGKVYEKDASFCSSIEGIIYIILSALMLVVSIAFAFLFSGLYFDIRMTKANHMSRLSPRYDLWIVICKIVVPFCFEVIDMKSESNKIILAFVLMIVSLWLYFVIKIHILFYSLLTQKIYETMILILSSTNSLLFIDLVAVYFGFVDFDGLFELWCFTIIFIVLYHLFSSENYSKALPLDYEDIPTSNKAITSVMALLRIVHQRQGNMEYEMILNGYIITHIKDCNNADCNLKLYLNRNHHLRYSTEGQGLLFQHLNDLFINYLALFPSDTSLRIIYSLFALEVLGKVNICRIHMITAMSSNPSYQQQFCLYRMSKIIEDDYLNFDDESVNLHIASTIVFDQHFQKFLETIKLIGVKYLEFWNAFVQEETNMKKIKLTGNVILSLIRSVFDLWEKLQEINPNDYDCLRLYGQFQVDVLNDKALGEYFISQSKEILFTSGHQIKLFKNDLNHLCFDGSPVLIASQVVNEGLVISQATNSLTHLFLYQKIELIGKDINILLPAELRECHAKVVKDFLLKNKSKKTIEKKKLRGMAMNKSGFIFPIKFIVILLPNLTKEANVAIRIKQNKKITHYTCHLMINSSLDIVNVSSQSFKFLNITEKGIWSIRNTKKIKEENRINIRYLIKEVNSVYSTVIYQKANLLQEAQGAKDSSSPSTTCKGWKDNNLLKKFRDERNALVHLYDFQQVYQVSYENNNKDPYITTILASQIESSIQTWNMSITNDYKGMPRNNSSKPDVTAFMNIFDVVFSQMPTGFYVIALDYVYKELGDKGQMAPLQSFKTISTTNLKMTGFLNKMTYLSDCKFKKNKWVKFDVQNGVFAVEVKEKGKTSTLMTILSPHHMFSYYNNVIGNNNTDNDNEKETNTPKSSVRSSKGVSAKEKDETSQNEEQKISIKHISRLPASYLTPLRKETDEGVCNVYNSLFFQDYSEGVLYYDLNPSTLTRSIFAKPTPKEGKSLAELTHFFENDTMKTDDDISSMKNNEDSDFNKAKYAIDKNHILKNKVYRTHKATLKQIIISWAIILIHLALSISALVFYDSFLRGTKNNILTMSRIAALLNYTLTSTSYFLDTLVYPYVPDLTMNDLISLHYNSTQKLQWNAQRMYNTIAISDLFLIDTFNEINASLSMNITMIVLISVNADNAPLTSENHLPFTEAVNYLMAATYSLGSDPNLNTAYFTPDGFFLCFNSINAFYLTSMDYLKRIRAIVHDLREPNANQLTLIYVSVALNAVLLFMLYIWISFSMRKMNEIILEFLSIKHVEAQFVKKKMEKFIKMVFINDLEADEKDKEDDLEVTDQKRNNKHIADKMRQMQSEEVSIIAIIFALYLLLTFGFILQYVIINSYDNYTNQVVELYCTLNEFIGTINLMSIGVRIRLFSNEDITMLHEPINRMIDKQFDSFLILKEMLVSEIQLNGQFSDNFTTVYNEDIAVDKLPFHPSKLKAYLNSLPELSFDNTLAYFYNTLRAFYHFSLSATKEEALKDLRILYATAIQDYVLGPYLSLVSKATIADTVNTEEAMNLFVFIWFWVWMILWGILFFFIWLPFLSRLEREITNSKCLILLIPTSILMKKKAFLEILKNEHMISIRK